MPNCSWNWQISIIKFILLHKHRLHLFHHVPHWKVFKFWGVLVSKQYESTSCIRIVVSQKRETPDNLMKWIHLEFQTRVSPKQLTSFVASKLHLSPFNFCWNNPLNSTVFLTCSGNLPVQNCQKIPLVLTFLGNWTQSSSALPLSFFNQGVNWSFFTWGRILVPLYLKICLFHRIWIPDWGKLAKKHKFWDISIFQLVLLASYIFDKFLQDL